MTDNVRIALAYALWLFLTVGAVIWLTGCEEKALQCVCVCGDRPDGGAAR